MSAITINTNELKSLIRDAVNEAFDARIQELRRDWDDEMTDAALARAIDEARALKEPSIPLDDYLKELQAQIDEA